MKNIVASLFSKIFPQIILALVVGSTIATGTAAGIKMIKANATEPAAEIQQVQPAPAEELYVKKIKSAVIPKSTVPTRSEFSAANNNTQCVISLFGKQYDVTSLRKSHPGGDVFVCGTDQSATYQKTHGTDMSRMQAYLVTGGGASTTEPSSTVRATGSSGASTFYDDDEESEEELSRYANTDDGFNKAETKNQKENEEDQKGE